MTTTTDYTYWCSVCTSTFTSAKSAQRHARGRGHVVLVEYVLEPTTTTTTTTTERTPEGGRDESPRPPQGLRSADMSRESHSGDEGWYQ